MARWLQSGKGNDGGDEEGEGRESEDSKVGEDRSGLAGNLIVYEINPDEKEVETAFEMATNFPHAMSWLLGESKYTEVIEATI